ncbi:DUF4129 domain-containing protein [Prosthecobacter sp.]|uniref:DUF4129 domain-containing protein n=1 Tax=Prosthecobacter sp. TaxID=1965333 RepID=UPI0037836FFA
MRLEDITVVLRPRQPWEAVDLGCAMVRRDYGGIIALWACTVLPLWALVCVLLRSTPEWIPLAVWWLKPLYDRVPLFFLSRAAFGVRPTFLETWKQWPRLWISNCLPALFWRRLSFIRSFALPAQMLEGLRGSAVNQRIRTLAMDGGGSGFSLSYAFSKIELVAWLGLMWGTYGLLPEYAQPDWGGLFESLDFHNTIPSGFLWWGAACHMVIVSLVEPFYVGAGFALYLNCRTRIEGWDVELAFRRMATRLSSAAAAVIIAVLALGCMPSHAQAAEEADAPGAVEKVLKHPDFEIHKMPSRVWVPDLDPDEVEKEKEKEKEKERSRDTETDGTLGSLLSHFGFFGGFGFIFWVIIAGLVAWLIVYLVNNRHLFISRGVSNAPVRAPKVLMGMNITPESLPVDLVASARAAWAAGDFKEALSLLYRGSLSWLVNRRRVPISDSDTEEDCLLQVLQAGEKTEADYFRQLTGAWVQVAYAVMPVSNEEMGALCDQWPFVERKGGAA